MFECLKTGKHEAGRFFHCLVAFYLASVFAATPVFAQFVLKGSVVDSLTSEPVVSAHLTVRNSTVGTITNDDGQFILQIDRLPATVLIQHLGYETWSRVIESPDEYVEVRLTPTVYLLGEVLVTGEDAINNLIQKVINTTRQRRSHLSSYAAEGYTRLTLDRNNSTVLLLASVYDQYVDVNKGRREVITSLLRTASFYDRLPIDPTGTPIDLQDETIGIHGANFVGPLHSEAMKYYTFTIGSVQRYGDLLVYNIYFAPKNSLSATFIGRLSVADSVFALVEAELRPARHVEFNPPVTQWDVFYRQQFRPTADSFWLPIDLHLEGKVQFSLQDIDYAPSQLRQTSYFNDYRVNVEIPDRVFNTPDRVLMDTSSVLSDPLFLAGREVLPMAVREVAALEQLGDRSITLEEALPPPELPRSFAAFLSRRRDIDGPQFTWPVIMGYQPWLRYNRIDGHLFGIGQTMPFSPQLTVTWRAAQTTGLTRVRFHGDVLYRLGRSTNVSFSYFRDTEPSNSFSLYTTALTSINARLGGSDYYDYYWRKGMRFGVSYSAGPARYGIVFKNEKHESVPSEVSRAWPFDHELRDNPEISDGFNRAVQFSWFLGDRFDPLRTSSANGLHVYVEHTNQTWLPSDFDYTKMEVRFDGALPLFFRNRIKPQTLHIRGQAGYELGDVPVHASAIIDGSVGYYSTFGSLSSLRNSSYSGKKLLGLFWEFDFGPILPLSTSIFKRSNSATGLRLIGGHGFIERKKSARNDDAVETVDGVVYHHEVGLALTNILGTPFRVNLTYRLDDPGLSLSVGLTRIP